MASYEWIEKRRLLWNPQGAEDHPLWLARVRGKKPKSSIDTLFTQQLIDFMLKAEPRHHFRKIVTSCDPARMGDDECVIYGGDSGRIREKDIMPQSKGDAVCSHVLQVNGLVGGNCIIIDVDGLGGPIADFIDKLKARDVDLIQVHSEGNAEDEQYDNLKAEMWFYAKAQAELGMEKIPDDEYLKQELMEMKYFINPRGKIQIEAKDDLKERIGRSPDRADAWVMNVWARKSSRIVRNADRWTDREGGREVVAGATSAMAA
jgi:hypothetical protein